MHIRSPLPLAVALLLAALALPPAWSRPAAAEEPAEAGSGSGGAPPAERRATPRRPSAPPESDIEEIIILGGESEAAGDFGAADSVTGFSAADLAALGASSVEDLAGYTPNLEIVTAGATTPTFFIRGVGLNDFNANAVSAVAVYEDDVPKNAQGLQLGTLFDTESVSVLRGPQGTGPSRNASAGAIKVYSRKPTGEFGGYLNASFGNYDYRDYEGAVEAPIYQDILSTRLAFRLRQRDGYGKNRCAGAPADPVPLPDKANPDPPRPPYAHCGEVIITQQQLNPSRQSEVPPGLPSRVNDVDNWAARGQLLFQPTLDMTWLLNAHGSQRDELSRLGQFVGLGRGQVTLADGSTPNYFGGSNSAGARDQDIVALEQQLTEQLELRQQLDPTFTCIDNCVNNAKLLVRESLVDLDPHPYAGDYNRVGPTRNAIWGAFLRGDVVLPGAVRLRTITAYDTYDRLIDVDLDQSPNEVIETVTNDSVVQLYQELELSGDLGERAPLTWDLGAYYLQETLDVFVQNFAGVDATFSGVASRDYTQRIFSWATYAGFSWDLGRKFTLDGGVRYNWERKDLDFALQAVGDQQKLLSNPSRIFQAPTGTLRLTYRFREDTQAYWKYTHGWKSGHFNATTSRASLFGSGVVPADPEVIDAFETGLTGSWLTGRLSADLSLFYYSYDNYQLFTIQDPPPPSFPEFVIINASAAEVYGAELDLTGRPWSGAFVNVRLGWLESQFLDFTRVESGSPPGGFVSTQAIQIVNDYTGNRLLNSPRFTVSITAEQTIPLGPWGSLTPRYDARWTDTTFYDQTEGVGRRDITGQTQLPEGTIAQTPYWLHNVWLGYRPPIGNLEVAFWVRNLTGRVYKSFAFDATTFQRFAVFLVGEPRTYGLTFTVNF